MFYFMEVSMNRLIAALFVCVMIGGVAHARPRRSYNTYNTAPTYSSAPKTYSYTSETPRQYSYTSETPTRSYNDTSSAQGVAEIMARTGRVGHWGGNSGYEGCGSGSSQQAAYNNCCYANSNLTTVDVGYAQGNNGQWYCCRRYR
jgi:hypothetical protein